MPELPDLLGPNGSCAITPDTVVAESWNTFTIRITVGKGGLVPEDSLGLLLVDNIFTGKAITAEDAHLLEMIVSHATTSLRAAQLKESLKKNVESLKATYRKLKAYEERIMKAERLAISGELTSSVIHEIKNPLVAIGGFARNLYQSKDITGDDREKLEIIMNEALRLERYLEGLQSKVSELRLEEGDLNQVLEDN
jgi:signal transduction histidine kinase